MLAKFSIFSIGQKLLRKDNLVSGILKPDPRIPIRNKHRFGKQSITNAVAKTFSSICCL